MIPFGLQFEQKTSKKLGFSYHICRAKRAKCDGARPRCSTCVTLDQDCSYGPTALKRHRDDTKKRLNDLEKLYKDLKCRPEPDAQPILTLIRTEDDIGRVVQHIDDGDLLLRISIVPERPG